MGCSPWGCEESDTTERLHFHISLSRIGEGNGNPLQCSCLENPRDRGAWWAAIYGVAQSQTRLKWLSNSSSNLCCTAKWLSYHIQTFIYLIFIYFSFPLWFVCMRAQLCLTLGDIMDYSPPASSIHAISYSIYACHFLLQLWFITGYWIHLPVLYSWTLLFILPIYNSLHLLIPDFQAFPPLTPSHLVTTSLFSMSESVSVLWIGSFVHISDSTCKWYRMVFAFLFLTYFT